MKNSRRSRGGRPHNDEKITSALDVNEAVTPRQRRRKISPLTPKTENQERFISAINNKQIVFGIGNAGCGKTYIAAREAARMLEERQVEKIILTRPPVEVGTPIGFLPGELEDKMRPYMASFGRGFTDQLGSGHFEYLLQSKVIEVVPLGFMQGLSFDFPTAVLFDEAENATPKEFKMFLTRAGEGARMIITGDPSQRMINGPCGLTDATKRIGKLGEVAVISFGRQDVVRSGVVRKILDAYDDDQFALTDSQASFDLPEFIKNGASR